MVQDFIEEVQVKQSGWNAEYRAALGGVVNAVTKTGSNSFHGSAGAYYTDNEWLGDIRRTLRSVPTNAAAAESVQSPRDESHQTDLVVPLGGPIMKDKVWFFAGYAPQFYPAERTVTWTNPGTFPATQTFDNGDAEQQGPQLQRDLAARQLAAGAFHRQQRDAEGRPRASGHRTQRHQHGERGHVQPALPGVHRTVLECLQRHRRLGGDREDLRQRDGGLSRLRPAQRRRRLLPRHAPHVQHHERRTGRCAGRIPERQRLCPMAGGP